MRGLHRFIAALGLALSLFGAAQQAQGQRIVGRPAVSSATPPGLRLFSTAAGLPQQGALGLWLEARDATTTFQNLAGTTAATTAGQTVGQWKDKSAAGFNLAAFADDTTRPTLGNSGSLWWVAFDGSNDVIYRAADLGLWSAGSYTLAISYKSTSPALSARLFAEGNSGDGNPFVPPIAASGVTASTSFFFYRSNVGTAVVNAAGPTAFDGNDHVMIVVDTGSAVNVYVDGVLTSVGSYTRAGNSFTLDRTSLGALVRTTAGSYFTASVYALAVWPGVNLGTSDRAQALTYMAALQGRTL